MELMDQPRPGKTRRLMCIGMSWPTKKLLGGFLDGNRTEPNTVAGSNTEWWRDTRTVANTSRFW
jgi:hypothetical protein